MNKIILIDIDNVLAGFNSEVLTELEKVGVEITELKDFYIINNFKKEYKEKIEQIYLEVGFFKRLKPLFNSIQGVRKLEQEGFTVFLCSSLLYKNPTALEDRRGWIVNNLGEDFLKKTVFASDKTLVKGDYLIDDKPEITGVLEPNWKHIVFRQPYNMMISSNYELRNWENDELNRLIKQLREERS